MEAEAPSGRARGASWNSAVQTLCTTHQKEVFKGQCILSKTRVRAGVSALPANEFEPGCANTSNTTHVAAEREMLRISMHVRMGAVWDVFNDTNRTHAHDTGEHVAWKTPPGEQGTTPQ